MDRVSGRGSGNECCFRVKMFEVVLCGVVFQNDERPSEGLDFRTKVSGGCRGWMGENDEVRYGTQTQQEKEKEKDSGKAETES